MEQGHFKQAQNEHSTQSGRPAMLPQVTVKLYSDCGTHCLAGKLAADYGAAAKAAAAEALAAAMRGDCGVVPGFTVSKFGYPVPCMCTISHLLRMSLRHTGPATLGLGRHRAQGYRRSWVG